MLVLSSDCKRECSGFNSDSVECLCWNSLHFSLLWRWGAVLSSAAQRSIFPKVDRKTGNKVSTFVSLCFYRAFQEQARGSPFISFFFVFCFYLLPYWLVWRNYDWIDCYTYNSGFQFYFGVYLFVSIFFLYIGTLRPIHFYKLRRSRTKWHYLLLISNVEINIKLA